jgi:hypothetical protein
MKLPAIIHSIPLYTGLATGSAAAIAVGFIPGVLPVAAGAAGVLAFAGGLIGTSFERKEKNEDELEVAPVEVSPSLPDELKAQVLRLRKIVLLHASVDSPVFTEINSILALSQELFNRIMAKQESQAHRLAAVNYTDTLKKLNRALDSDYYLDIKKNPRLWSAPEQRIQAVEKAVEATEHQLVRNIQQVNASQDIEYEISLESLTNSMDSADVSGLTQ